MLGSNKAGALICAAILLSGCESGLMESVRTGGLIPDGIASVFSREEQSETSESDTVALAAENAAEAGPRIVDIPSGFVAVQSIRAVRADPTPHGLILRATANNAASLHSATLVPAGAETGSARYLMIARQGGSDAEGTLVATLFVPDRDVRDARLIRIDGAEDGRSIRLR